MANATLQGATKTSDGVTLKGILLHTVVEQCAGCAKVADFEGQEAAGKGGQSVRRNQRKGLVALVQREQRQAQHAEYVRTQVESDHAQQAQPVRTVAEAGQSRRAHERKPFAQFCRPHLG